MRNRWKGLVVGGLTGVTAGFVLDAISGVSKKAQAVGEEVRHRAPEGGRWLRSVTDKAGDQVKQAGIGVVAAAKDAVADHHG